MWCMKCQKELYECTCADIDERLSKLAKHPNVSIAAKQNQQARKIFQEGKSNKS